LGVRLFLSIATALGLFAALLAVIAWVAVLPDFFSARKEPSGWESVVVRRLRRLAIDREIRDQRNPIALTPDVLADARAHFADHCAICHANDGSGKTDIGENAYPPAPDMREEPTQSLSDGELFYAIHNGVRFTAMPAWGGDSPDEDQASWKLVHFIRHLPHVTKEELREMQALNPKSPQEIEEEKAADAFLRGGEKRDHPDGHHH
jgi:mono/diheme cytochrome c family protein